LVRERPHDAPHPPQPRRSFRGFPAKYLSAAVPLPQRGKAYSSCPKRLVITGRIRKQPSPSRVAKRVTKRVGCAMKALPRWGRGTAAEEKREYLERFSDAVAVDEVHHTDALSHLRKRNRS